MATTLTDLLLPLTASSPAVANDLSYASSEIVALNDQINPGSSNSVGQLIQQDGSTLDFSGLGAQAFQKSISVHLALTGKLLDAFNGAAQALTTFTNTVNTLNSQYDGRLNSIRGTSYAPGFSWDSIAAGARATFAALRPETAMIDDVIALADGNAVLQSGASDLLNLLTSAYMSLLGQAEKAFVPLPAPEATPANQMRARAMVIQSLDTLYSDIKAAYSSWGTDIQHAFSTYTSAMSGVEQTVQPYTDLLTQPLSAASIFDMIQMLSQSNEPIAIVRTGPNSILVMISGTNLSKSGYDTNIWNALMTGMGQNSPFEQDIIAAIQEFCAQNGLTNPAVTLAGHSLGGMVAQQIAERGLFNVKQVVTYGSPTMGNPVPGISYDIYAAKWDAVPMLSRYENPTLPGSLQQVAAMFPSFQTNYQSFWHNPFSWSGLTHDVSAIGRDIGATFDNVLAAKGVKTGVPFLLGEVTGSYAIMAVGAKQEFMDPHDLYGNSIKIVPDLTTISPAVHSDYGQSRWLENKQIIFQPLQETNGDMLDHIEYFGMPYEFETGAITKYMVSHSSIGQLLHLLHKS